MIPDRAELCRATARRVASVLTIYVVPALVAFALGLWVGQGCP